MVFHKIPHFLQLFAEDLMTILFYVGLSVPKILRGDFSPKWDHLYLRYSGMTVSPRWGHLCPRCLGVMFHPSGIICAQNVRFYLEATIIVERSFCQFVGVFHHFPFVCFSSYIFYLTCSFLVFTWMGPSVPEIFRSDFSPKWDHVCPKRNMSPRSNYFCGEVILPICCCFPLFPICLLLLIYVFIWLVLFCLLVGFHPSGTICAQNI